jgi:hypothetical protein
VVSGDEPVTVVAVEAYGDTVANVTTVCFCFPDGANGCMLVQSAHVREGDAMAEVLVAVHEEDAGSAEIDRLVSLLRAELLQLEVDDVRPARSDEPAPAGSRGVDVAAVGALIVSVKPGIELLGTLVRTVRSWLQRGPSGRSVELTVGEVTIKLTNTSESAQESLIEEFARAVAQE